MSSLRLPPSRVTPMNAPWETTPAVVARNTLGPAAAAAAKYRFEPLNIEPTWLRVMVLARPPVLTLPDQNEFPCMLPRRLKLTLLWALVVETPTLRVPVRSPVRL